MRFYIYADFNVQSATYNWQLIHAPENFYSMVYGSPVDQNKAFAYNISMDKEMNRAGSLSFTIAKGHPQYSAIFPLGTTIAVTTPTQIPTTTTALAEGDTTNPIVVDGVSKTVAVGDCVCYNGTYFAYRKDEPEVVPHWHVYQEIGHVVWFGRILSIERNFNLEKNITCEGALAFLNDIMIRPRKFFIASGQNEGKAYAMSALDIFDMCRNEYNQTVINKGVYKRQIHHSRVVVPREGTYASTTTPLHNGDTTNPITVNGESYIAHIGDKFEYTDPLTEVSKTFRFEDQQVMNSDRTNGIWYEYTKHTGYIVETTYTEISDYVTAFDKLSEIANLDPAVGMWCECTDDTKYELTLYFAYLPWLQNPSKILFAQNLTEFTDNGDGQDIYNAVIPLGANKIHLNETTATTRDSYMRRVPDPGGVWFYDVPRIDYIGSADKYGYIEKTIDYSDIDDSSVLYDYAALNLDAYANRDGKSFSIGAVELSLLSENRGTGYNELLLTDMLNADYNPNNFINIGDGVYFSSPPHDDMQSNPRYIALYNRFQFTCTSFKMEIDNPGATNYTFEVYDTNYIPLQPKLLTSYLDKKRAIAEGKIAKDGTIYYANRQGTTIIKEDDNHVVETTNVTGDHEKHYVAEGEGNTRTDMQVYETAYGTTPIPSNESNETPAGGGEMI